MSNFQPVSKSTLLELIPQRSPFRFVDEITEVDELKIIGNYTFKNNESFYEGHFPGKPVTPGVILLESMCQIGVVALGIYLLSMEKDSAEVSQWTTFFSDAQVDFLQPVFPGQKVIVKAEKIFWRRMKLRCQIQMTLENGSLVAQATASGMGVRNG